MVTWQDLFAFCMLIVAIISLVIQVNDKKKQLPKLPSSQLLPLAMLGTDLLAAPLCISIIPQYTALSTPISNH